MTPNRFKTVFEDTVSKCGEILLEKAAEYSTEADRLHNFKLAARLQGCEPETALGGMMAKHTVSVFDYINLINTADEKSLEQWDEKLIDDINYRILLRALIIERLDWSLKDEGGME